MERLNKIRGVHTDKIITDLIKPDLILTSDWHLRETQPICRTDDFWEAQWKKVDWIARLQKWGNCPVIHAGDLFHHWKPSPYLLSTTMEHLPDDFYTIFGQHDLPQNSLELKHKSGIHTLNRAGRVQILPQGHWDSPMNIPGVWTIKRRDIYVMHRFTYIGKDPWPGIEAPKGNELLNKYPEFDLIVTGDNHQPFIARGKNDNLLVNPGCLTRQRASETHEPRVYLWYADKNHVVDAPIPYEKDVITREHIDRVDEMDERIEAFVSRFKEEWENTWGTSLGGETVSFEENLERFFESNRVRQQVKDIIYKALEND